MREIRIFGKGTLYPSTDVIVSNVEDFQVILKDKDGKVIVPVCTEIWGRCGPTEISLFQLVHIFPIFQYKQVL